MVLALLYLSGFVRSSVWGLLIGCSNIRVKILIYAPSFFFSSRLFLFVDVGACVFAAPSVKHKKQRQKLKNTKE